MSVSGVNTPSWRSSLPIAKHDFSGPASSFTFSAILSDMDGTIIDSTPAIVKYWEKIGQEYGIDPKVILATSHGRRSIDVFQQIDPTRATWAYVQDIEGQIPLMYGADAVTIPGARELLESLEAKNARWAIVTSGTKPLVEGWLKVMRLSEPRYMVTAEAVTTGKPDPECYRMAITKLELLNSKMPALVLEDAPAGIRAGKAAGCKVLALATTHKIEELKISGADWIIQDLRSVEIRGLDDTTGNISVQISNTLR